MKIKTSEVFKHAKRYLATTYNDDIEGQDKFICIAIMIAASHTKRITDADIERCTDIVESRLEGETTMERWLQHRGCIHGNWALVDLATRNRIQQHRHAWLDTLIAEFKAKGD